MFNRKKSKDDKIIGVLHEAVDAVKQGTNQVRAENTALVRLYALAAELGYEWTEGQAGWIKKKGVRKNVAKR